MKLRAFCCLIATIATIATSVAAPSEYVGVTPELISEAKTIVPGQTFTVALSLKHEEGYHTYWVNPGIAGLAPSLEWTLPEGFTAGEIQWQVPERCKMVIYDAHGYNGDTLLLVDITAPNSLPEGNYILKAKSGWMACGKEAGECCNLGYENFTLNLKSGSGKEWNASVREKISQARRKLPRAIDGWEYSCKRIGDQLVLKVKGAAGLPLTKADGIYFYSKSNHITTLVKQEIQVEGSEVTVILPISEWAPKKIENLSGLFFYPGGWPGAAGQQYLPIDLVLE